MMDIYLIILTKTFTRYLIHNYFRTYTIQSHQKTVFLTNGMNLG